MRGTKFLGAGASLVAFIVLLLICGVATAQIIPGRYIVVFRDDVADPPAAAAAIARANGFAVGHVYSIAIKGFCASIPDAALPAVKANPRVAYVEPDLMMYAFGQTVPTGVDRIDADLNTTTGEGVDIAIIDTGIDDDHPDLNVVGGRHFYSIRRGNRLYSYEDANYDDDNGHGSHCAGIAAAKDNDIGVVGVAPGARLWAVKVLDASGSGYISDTVKGIDWVTARASTIEVANMSLGGQGRSDALRTAIQSSVAAGVVYVVAAGNKTMDVYGDDGIFDSPVEDDFIPAAYPEVAAISAMADSDGQPGGLGSSTVYGPDDSFASFSDYSGSVVSDNPVTSPGAAIDLILPGVSILSTYKNGGYAKMSGTSMASPHAAGLAALYIAQYGRDIDGDGDRDADDVYAIRQALIDGGVAQTDVDRGLTVQNDPDDNKENIGWAGPLDPVTDIAITSVDAPASVVQGDVVDVSVTVKNVGNQAVTSDITVTLTDETDEVTIGEETISGGLIAGASETLIYSWDTAGASTGDHALEASYNFTDDDNPSNDSTSTVVSVESALTDIAITAVSAPSSVVQGAVVGVNVTVENMGNQNVTSGINVTLTDTTDSVTIGEETISGGLAAGASTTLSYTWNTTGASLGDHTLTASHDFTDDNASNNSNSTTVTVNEEQNSMHVKSIIMDGFDRQAGKNIFVWATATVTVIDANDNPVEGATVVGHWSGAATDSDSGTTGSSGEVTLTSDEKKNPSTEFKFCVDDVTHDVLTYVPEANDETCDQWPPLSGSSIVLLQAFPTPGNPEVWIPFKLANTEHVIIRIYDAAGRLVRILDLGHKAPGAYVSKEKAAYWDGRNESGEEATSGIYFYLMEAGSFRAMKKMIILK